MDATTMTTPHIGEYIADIGNFPPRSQLERQEERGGIFIIIFYNVILKCYVPLHLIEGYRYGKYELIFLKENEKW